MGISPNTFEDNILLYILLSDSPSPLPSSWKGDNWLTCTSHLCSELNQIVLDYLIVEGYRDAAIEFAAEAGLTLRVDVEGIQERMLIRDALEAGRVDEAIRRVNELDSEVSIGIILSPAFHPALHPRRRRHLSPED